MTLTSLVLSIFVNALVSGLIVFRIHNVFKGVKRTSVEQALGSSGDTALRHVIFVIIESGMTLLVIQLVRVIIGNVNENSVSGMAAFFVVTGINEMFNVIIRSIHFFFFFVLLMTFTRLGHHANNNFGAGLNEVVLL